MEMEMGSVWARLHFTCAARGSTVIRVREQDSDANPKGCLGERRTSHRNPGAAPLLRCIKQLNIAGLGKKLYPSEQTVRYPNFALSDIHVIFQPCYFRSPR